MELRTACSPKDEKYYDTARLRSEFLIDDLFKPDDIKLVYSHIDRIITGSAVPVNKVLKLTAGDELRAEYFLQRREMGVINIGGAGIITIDGKEYPILDTFTPWSKGLHIPWLHILANDLEPGRHVLKMKVLKGERQGCYIRNYVVN